MNGIILFFVLQLANVVLGTMRSILTVKSTPTVAALINAISFTFYNAIVKMISGQDMAVVLLATFTTNIAGVFIAKWILNFFKKDKLWIFNTTIKTPRNYNINDICELLKVANIEYLYNTVVDKELYSLQIFAYTQKDSVMVESILKKYNISKYYITEDKR